MENRKTKQVLSRGLVPVGERRWGKGVGGWIWCKYYVHMYVNGKMRLVETTQEWGIKDKGEWWKAWIQVRYIIKTFVNITMYNNHTSTIITINKFLKNKMLQARQNLSKKKTNTFRYSHTLKLHSENTLMCFYCASIRTPNSRPIAEEQKETLWNDIKRIEWNQHQSYLNHFWAKLKLY
jgi:hypothetical protein